MGSGGGQQTSTEKSSSHLPGYDIPAAKAYLSSLMGLVFPGMTMPSNYLPKGWDFGSGGSGGGGSGGQGGTANQIQTPPLDPTLAYNVMNPMIGSSPYLQKLYQQNPGAVTSAMSPASFNQLAQIYGNVGGSPTGSA